MDMNRLRQLAGLGEQEQINEVRDITNRVIEAMDEGILDPRVVADACLGAMSEDEVAEMAHANELFSYDEDDDDDEGDDMGNDYFDDLDAGDTEMDRRSDLRRGW